MLISCTNNKMTESRQETAISIITRPSYVGSEWSCRVLNQLDLAESVAEFSRSKTCLCNIWLVKERDSSIRWGASCWVRWYSRFFVRIQHLQPTFQSLETANRYQTCPGRIKYWLVNPLTSHSTCQMRIQITPTSSPPRHSVEVGYVAHPANG